VRARCWSWKGRARYLPSATETELLPAALRRDGRDAAPCGGIGLTQGDPSATRAPWRSSPPAPDKSSVHAAEDRIRSSAADLLGQARVMPKLGDLATVWIGIGELEGASLTDVVNDRAGLLRGKLHVLRHQLDSGDSAALESPWPRGAEDGRKIGPRFSGPLSIRGGAGPRSLSASGPHLLLR
jgi:hypothetical protein